MGLARVTTAAEEYRVSAALSMSLTRDHRTPIFIGIPEVLKLFPQEASNLKTGTCHADATGLFPFARLAPCFTAQKGSRHEEDRDLITWNEVSSAWYLSSIWAQLSQRNNGTIPYITILSHVSMAITRRTVSYCPAL